MKKIRVVLVVFLSLGMISCSSRNVKKKDIVDKEIQFAMKQLKYALEIVEPLRSSESKVISPRSLKQDGSVKLVPSRDWTSGFFPGELWMMYEFTGDKFWKSKAEFFTEALEKEKINGKTHDMGFKMFCSYGQGYSLTGNKAYREVLIKSAKTLMTRFNSSVGCIRSWDHNKKRWSFPVIIDNMMNLELLFWAYNETGDSSFKDVAVKHALTTMKNHFREDYSSFHVVDYCPVTGRVKKKQTHQGYADQSAWARGQAWALYGYTMCYRETGMKQFLELAENIAGYILSHPRLPDDSIPYWDFDAPGIPDESRDVSAAAVISSALYELSGYSERKDEYIRAADKILTVLSSKKYKSPKGDNEGFLLLHSVGSMPMEDEVDVPLVYADYYYLEAIKRKMSINK